MDKFIPVVNITHGNIDEISLEDVVAFTYAHYEAKGEGDIYFLLNKDGFKYYYINFIYGDNQIVDRVFDGFFKPFADHLKSHNYLFYDLFEGWKDYCGSRGTYMFLRNEYVERFEKVANSYPRGIVDGMVFNIDKVLYETFMVNR